LAEIDFSDPQSYFATATGSVPGRSRPHFSLTVASDPSVPMLDVYATAPTASGAMNLIDASVNGLRDYLSRPGATESAAPSVALPGASSPTTCKRKSASS